MFAKLVRPDVVAESNARKELPYRYYIAAVLAILIGLVVFTSDARAGIPGIGSSSTSAQPIAMEQADAPLSPTGGTCWTVMLTGIASGLYGVAVISPDDIWAVPGDSQLSVNLHWDGTAWSQVPRPNPGGANGSGFSDLAAVGVNDVWAVGSYRDANLVSRTMIIHWDGNVWSVVPSPNVNADGNVLFGVTAISTNDVWAVGYYRNASSVLRTLILHWDGNVWSVVPSPNADASNNRLTSVAAISTNDVWAVGCASECNSGADTLTLHWDGNVWSVVPSPNAPSNENLLEDVTANSTDDVWAVGSRPAMAIHWNGSQWSLVSIPSPPGSIYVNGVAAVSANDVWAVGTDGGQSAQTLAWHFDGTQWSIVPSPNPGSGSDIFREVAAWGASIWAVGSSYNPSHQALVARHDPCGSTTPTVAPPSMTPTSTRTITSTRTPIPQTNTPTPILASPTNTRTPTPTPCYVYTGSITTSDPSQTGRLTLDATTAACLGSKPCPSIANTNPHHYDAYTFTNTANGFRCVTVTLDATGCGGQPIFSAAYLNSFDPNNLCANYMNDPGLSPAPSNQYSLWVPANTTFVVVVHELNPNAGCPSYNLTLTGLPCATATPTPTNEPPTGTAILPTSTATPAQATNTAIATSTSVPPTATSAPPTSTATVTPAQATNTAIATATQAPCTVTFTDVPEGSTFYTFIRCLACRGIISGYADGTFKPNNLVTRGQLAKIVSNAAGFTESPDPQIFEDVPSANTFYQWINRLARRGHMSGYACGGVGEPCTTGMPYFRPFANATRGQTSKIVSNAAGYTEIPTDQTFEDVPATHTFYREIQRLATRNIMQGYPCGGVGEPCLSGKPYFRPSNNVTRGQSAKIVANTFYPGCDTP